MMISFTPKILTFAILSVSLAACKGGSDGNSSTSNNSPQTAVTVTTDQAAGQESITTTTETDGKTVVSVSTPDKNTVDVNNTAVDPNANMGDIVTNVPTTTSDPNVVNAEHVLARINSRRQACGFGTLSTSKALTDAARNHANYLLYMSKNSDQVFQGHYEIQQDDYTGIKNPYFSGKEMKDRVNTASIIGTKATPVDYKYRTLGENLAYLKFNTDYLQTNSDKEIAISSINGLFAAPYHLASLVSPLFSQVGIGYGRGDAKKPIQLANGSTVAAQGSILEIVSASPLSQDFAKIDKVLSYPCNGIADTAYELKHESPNPFKGSARSLATNPIGQPIYILGNGEIKVTNYKLKDAANQNIPLIELNASNDPNGNLTNKEVILMPSTALKPSQSYKVSYDVSVDNGIKRNKNFVFSTKAK